MTVSMKSTGKMSFELSNKDKPGSLAAELIVVVSIVLLAIVIGGLILGATNGRVSRIADAIKSPPPTSAVSPTPGSTTPSNTGW